MSQLIARAPPPSLVCHNDTIFRDDFDRDGLTVQGDSVRRTWMVAMSPDICFLRVWDCRGLPAISKKGSLAMKRTLLRAALDVTTACVAELRERLNHLEIGRG